ncbi:MAG: hypothetical protein WD941_01405 [Opitutus sp.]
MSEASPDQVGSPSSGGGPPVSSPRTRQRGRKLALLGGGAAAALATYRVWTTDLQDPLLIALGLAMIGLGAFPAIAWARSGEMKLPAFEVMMLAGIPFYAFPLFDQHVATVLFSDEVILQAAMAVVVFQASTLLAYFALRGRPGRSTLWRESLLSDAYLRHTRVGLAVTTIYQLVSQFTEWIPPEIGSVLRALFYGIGVLCAFIQVQRWGTGLLRPSEKNFVAGNIIAQVILHISGLYLISGASLLLLALISYTSASRKFPLLAAAAGLAVFGLLQNGKASMRAVYWQSESPKVSLSDLPAFFNEWINYSLAQRAETDEGLTTRLLERTSLFHVLCIVIDAVPSRQPHLDGETSELLT